MDRQLKRKGILFVIIGPTGSGKSTFCGRLVNDFAKDLHYSISVTSRAPRANEVPGKSYHFVSRDEFIARREKGDFFEWEETHGNLYGTLLSNLHNGIDHGVDLLFQIDIRGAMSLKRSFPDNTVSVFLVPPSFEALKSRLMGRGTVDPHELQRRFATAREEYAALRKLSEEHGKIDYLVLNHDLENTYSQIRSIVVAERSRYHRMDQCSVSQFCEVNDVGA
jgi:guanylate kinase